MRITTRCTLVVKYAWSHLRIRLNTSYYPDVNSSQSNWRIKPPVVATVTWTREFQNMRRTTDKCMKANPHNGSEIRRRAMIFHTLLFVITTYRRFFEAKSAYFSVWKPNTNCCYTSPWETSRVVKTNGNHQESNQCTPKYGKQNIRTVFGFRNKNANVPVTITLRARAILTNHGLRRCPWHVHAWWGRGGRGTKIKTSHFVKRDHGLKPTVILVAKGWLRSVRNLKVSTAQFVIQVDNTKTVLESSNVSSKTWLAFQLHLVDFWQS